MLFSSLESTAMIGPSPGSHWLQFGHLASIASTRGARHPSDRQPRRVGDCIAVSTSFRSEYCAEAVSCSSKFVMARDLCVAIQSELLIFTEQRDRGRHRRAAAINWR